MLADCLMREKAMDCSRKTSERASGFYDCCEEARTQRTDEGSKLQWTTVGDLRRRKATVPRAIQVVVTKYEIVGALFLTLVMVLRPGASLVDSNGSKKERDL